MSPKKYYYTRRHLYEQIVNEFEQAYSWLGRQVAEEFLLAMASWNIDHYIKPDWRARQHILLFWKHGWLKSTLIKRFRDILGVKKSKLISDISNAALRGTVDKGDFIPPIVIQYPFICISELGKLTTAGDKDLVQTFLMVLEEGEGGASLAKIAKIKDDDREIISMKYPILFTDPTSFEYQTDAVFLCATYSAKFIEDVALQSRFNIVIPQRPLTGELSKYIEQHGKFNIADNTKQELYNLLNKPPPMNFDYRLADEIYETDPSPRDISKLKSWAWSRMWWGYEVDDTFILARFNQDTKGQLEAQSNVEDKMVMMLERKPHSVSEICIALSCTSAYVYRIINRNKHIRKLKDKELNKIVYVIER